MVLYFLQSTSVLAFNIDVVLTLFIKIYFKQRVDYKGISATYIILCSHKRPPYVTLTGEQEGVYCEYFAQGCITTLLHVQVR